MDASERSLRAKLAAHSLHGQYSSRELTAAARAASFARFLRQADPDEVLSMEERVRRAEHLRKAWMYKLALASARARRKGAES
jgi:hypothetical protein